MLLPCISSNGRLCKCWLCDCCRAGIHAPAETVHDQSRSSVGGDIAKSVTVSG